MKNLTILISALLFSSFFYQQNNGLNVLLFTILTFIIVAIKHQKNIKTIRIPL